MLSMGKYVMAISDAIMAKTKGIDSLTISGTDTPVNAEVRYRFVAIGGVTKPIAKLIVTITPKCIGSTPSGCTIASSSGEKIRLADMVSINIPTIKRNMLMIAKITYLLSEIAPIMALRADGN